MKNKTQLVTTRSLRWGSQKTQTNYRTSLCRECEARRDDLGDIVEAPHYGLCHDCVGWPLARPPQ